MRISSLFFLMVLYFVSFSNSASSLNVQPASSALKPQDVFTQTIANPSKNINAASVLKPDQLATKTIADLTSKYSSSPVSEILPKKPVDEFPHSSFTNYVYSCQSELKFDVIPQMDCRDFNFRPKINGPINDWVSHVQLNKDVDVLFACRWVEKNTGASGTATGEMLVHNRENGKTCFFKLKDESVVPEPGRDTSSGFLLFPGFNSSTLRHVPTTNPPSPTAPDAEKFWEQPEDMISQHSGDNDVCTRCHSAGPYIASPEIVGALARYGLINDGHDVWGEKYQAVESVFAKRFNDFIHKTIQPPTSFTAACADKCHIVGGNSKILDTTFIPRNFGIIMPSINLIIDDILKGHMPPNDPFSDYRWINRDSPADAGDYERLSDVEAEYNAIYQTCKSPTYMQAHEVDNTLMMQTDDFVDVIDTFNLHDGLICLNADQTSGKCNNYETRYRCNGKWTKWQSSESKGGTGDNENRSRYKFPSSCTSPYAIQARYYIGDKSHVVNGPPDRLHKFNKNGLVCRNKDQPKGESCHNYTVRFMCE